MSSDPQAMLRGLSFFAPLAGSPDLDEILGLAQPFTMPAGKLLFRQGDESDGMYVLGDGEIAIRARVPGDTETELARVRAGGVIGEVSLLNRGRRSASAEAVRETSGFFFSEQTFKGMRLAQRTSARKVMGHIADVICSRIRGRVADIARADAAFEDGAWSTSDDRSPVASSETRAGDDVVALLHHDALRTLPVFSPFTRSELGELFAVGRILDLERGHVLWKAGVAAERCLVTLRGAVALSVEGTHRAETCRIVGPGRFVGAVALTNGGPHPYDCTARERTWAFEVERECLAAITRAAPTLGYKLADVIVDALVEELRVLTRRVTRLSVEGRLQS